MFEGKRIKFDDIRKNMGNILSCPHCGGACLHLGKVKIFDREDDAEFTQVTTANKGQTKVELISSDICGNPSARSDGLIIDFWCQKCNAQSELAIAFHKAMTKFEWREDKQ